MIKKVLTALALFSYLTVTCFAADWYWMGNVNGANMWIDNETVQKNDDHAIVWVKLTDCPLSNGTTAKEVLFKMYVKSNCEGGWSYMQITYSDDSMTQYNNDLEIYPFSPDSFGYRVWKYIY